MRLHRLPTYMRKLWWLAHAHFHLSREGVERGNKISFYGVPIVSRCNNSTILIADRVTLCSDSRFTALGVSRPVILRTLRAGASIRIGADCGLSGTTVCAAISVEIGARCLIGADVVITDTDFHPVDSINRRYASEAIARAKPVRIDNDVFLGARTIVLPGVTIGQGAVVGAGSVVTRDIPPRSVCGGSPARVIRFLEDTEA